MALAGNAPPNVGTEKSHKHGNGLWLWMFEIILYRSICGVVAEQVVNLRGFISVKPGSQLGLSLVLDILGHFAPNLMKHIEQHNEVVAQSCYKEK